MSGLVEVNCTNVAVFESITVVYWLTDSVEGVPSLVEYMVCWRLDAPFPTQLTILVSVMSVP